jgi:hypothetical protein
VALPAGVIEDLAALVLTDRRTARQIVFIEYAFRNRIGRPVVPARIVGMLNRNGNYRAAANIGASPTLAAAQELEPNFKILMTHADTLGLRGIEWVFFELKT